MLYVKNSIRAHCCLEWILIGLKIIICLYEYLYLYWRSALSLFLLSFSIKVSTGQIHLWYHSNTRNLLTQLGKVDQVGTLWQRSRRIRITITHDWSPLALAFSAIKSSKVSNKHIQKLTGHLRDRGVTLLLKMEAFTLVTRSWAECL